MEQNPLLINKKELLELLEA